MLLVLEPRGRLNAQVDIMIHDMLKEILYSIRICSELVLLVAMIDE